MTDYTLADTIHFMFTTRRFDTGAPFALASGVISAYENEGLTQITAGITLGVDHDGVTGLNLITVVASGANGFEAGKDYHLVITTGTVNSVSVVGEVVGRFTLARSAAAVDLANATDGLSALKTLIDTVDDLLDTEIAAILAAVDTEVAAIKAKTDLIPGTVDGKTFIAGWTLVMAALLGKASGMGTTTGILRAVDDSKDRITATIDASGNRTAVTLDAT